MTDYKLFLLGCAMAIMLMLAFSSRENSKAPQPTLIAHGCPDAGGDLFAMNEDDFPYGCESIERNQ